MSTTHPSDDTERWLRERDFFDRQSSLLAIEAVPPATLDRYRRLKRPFFSPEYRYRVLGDLNAKRVLDVGCGDGTNAVILAKLGADVTGIDVSQGAIDAAGRRADINGVATRTRFVCAPLELAQFEPRSFDVIWGEAILHHLLADLDATLVRLMRWAKPDATVLFAEPVVLSQGLRRLRQLLPIQTDATPDERPLERAELDTVFRHLTGPTVRYFSFLGRFDRFVIRNENYEMSSAPRRVASAVLNVFDYGLLSLPFMSRLAGSCVIHGRPAVSRGQ